MADGRTRRQRPGGRVDQRTLDRLVQSITRELAEQESAPQPQRAPATGRERAGVYLVDNWRVRSGDRRAFLDFYITHVAEVIARMDGYQGGRILVSDLASDYSWHVQAYYEFASEDVLRRFKNDFNRRLRQVRSGMTIDKVLDEMDQWVLAHEDGTLTEVWR